MFKFYDTHKFGKTVRVSSGAVVTPGQIVTIEDTAVKLVKQVIRFPDGNCSWTFEKVGKDGVSEISFTSIEPHLASIAESLRYIVEYLFSKDPQAQADTDYEHVEEET